MRLQCFTMHNKRPCKKSVDFVLRANADNPQSRVFCDYGCFVNTYRANSSFSAAVDKERQAFVIYLTALRSGMRTLVDAHPLIWYATKYPNLKWDLWNQGPSAQMSTSGPHPPLDPFLEDENTPSISHTFEDKNTCMCLSGIALTCKVPEGEHWGQPDYKGGKE